TTNTKGTAYYHLVESYRDQGKVKQRTLLSLGRVEDGKLEQLAEAISKHTDKISVFNMAKDVDVKDTYILGPLLVLERMMAELGLSGCLTMLQNQHKKLQFDLKKVIFTQLCSRFVKPVSKLSLYDNWLGRMYPGLVEHDTAIQHLYRNLDLLYEHKDEIERYLFSYGKNLLDIHLGLTDEAVRLNFLKMKDSGRRFPAFWGPGFDWVPDHNWGGSGMTGIQEMLLQVDGDKIHLFLAWPKNKDVYFKLHAPDNTTVEASLKNGKIEFIKVIPEERRKDVVSVFQN
ncbi:MAG: hypothetical protein WAO52_14235, partial [Prolixibacteraceae bacterium]